jgi:hypothetical protein
LICLMMVIVIFGMKKIRIGRHNKNVGIWI